MIRNKNPHLKTVGPFLIAIILHAAIFATYAYVLKDGLSLQDKLSALTNQLKNSIKIDQIKIIKPSELEEIRKVGIKNGLRHLERPDIKVPLKMGGAQSSPLSFDQLTPDLPSPKPLPQNKNTDLNQMKNQIMQKNVKSENSYYFNYKDKKVIPKTNEQDVLKNEAINNLNGPMNKATEKLSNFEIRYERPEGVSEDELNSDEKAYYSFYVRSYKNYYAKIFSNYEKILVERPGLAKVFDRKHLLIGKIDYDENGNIVTVRILKSSDSDDLHYFFEETLKEMAQPNPPKIFTKNRKQFSIFYQIQIN